MVAQLTFDETFILSIWLEVLLYGLYLGLFCGSVYIIVQKRNFSTVPSKVMFGTMLIMFLFATIHVSMNLYRLLRGYVWLRDAPGGPAAYFADLAKWDHVFKDTIYATQSIIGDALAIYRCWIVWEYNYYVIALPLVLLVCSTFSGYIVAWLFTEVSNASIFSSRLQHWVSTFYSIALAQNIMTTSLIAYHIWQRDRSVKSLKVGGRSSLMPIVRIVIESAAIYVAAEFILVVLYALNNPAQYILLETITPTVGIVFTSITVRLALRSRSYADFPSTTSGINTGGNTSSIPMNPMSVHITRNIQKDMDEEAMSNDSRPMFDK